MKLNHSHLFLILFICSALRGFSLAPNYVPTVGLLGWYSFTGNSNNDAGVLYNGTISGATLTSDRYGYTNGAYLFDGVDDFITLGTSILSTSSSATVSCWIKSTDKTQAQNIFAKRRQSNGDGLNITIYNNNIYGVLNREPGIFASPCYTPFVTFTDTAWIHLALTNENGTLKLYHNGIEISQIVLQAGSMVGSQAFYIGKGFDFAPDVNGNRAFEGKIDDLGIWNRALTPQEISNLYTGTNNFYAKATGNLNLTSSWAVNPNGTGVSPTNFLGDNCTYHVDSSNNPVVGGKLTIAGVGSSLIVGNGLKTIGLTIASTDTLQCDSIVIFNKGSINNSGTVISNSIHGKTGSRVSYLGTSPQQIVQGRYGKIVTLNSSKTLLGNIIVSDTLDMASNITCGLNTLTIGTGTSNVGTLLRTSGYINGKLIRWYANTVTVAGKGLFPIGNSTRYTPLNLEYTQAPSTGGTVSCEFIPGQATTNGLPLFDFTNGAVLIDKLAEEGIWHLGGSGVTGGSFTLKLDANGFIGVTNSSALRIVRRDINGSWMLQGNAGSNSGNSMAFQLSRSGVTNTYGEYGIGGDQTQNQLPVKFTKIEATLTQHQKAIISWQTATEKNVKEYVVLRSTNTQDWSAVGLVIVQGNSLTSKRYKIEDDVNGITGTIYYEVIAFDYDKSTTHSDMVLIKLNAKETLSIYPNPFTNEIHLKGNEGPIVIYDSNGKQVAETQSGNFINTQHLSPGLYIIKTNLGTAKVIKE